LAVSSALMTETMKLSQCPGKSEILYGKLGCLREMLDDGIVAVHEQHVPITSFGNFISPEKESQLSTTTKR
jgi:hypothetical protein